MERFFLSLAGGLVASVASSRPFVFGDKERWLLQAYLPGCALLASAPARVDLAFLHVESDRPRLERTSDTVVLHDRWDGVLAADFYHLFAAFLRVRLLRQGLFSVHAACVGDDAGSVLIAGHSGVGKTALTLGLVRRTGWKLFSGNKTVVGFPEDGSLRAVAGTKTTTIRVVDRVRNADLIGEGAEYGGRFAFFMDPRFRAVAPSVRIRAIVLPRLNDGVAERLPLAPLGALHTLYPYFLDTVNADVLVAGGREVFVGTPPEGTQALLADRLRVTLGTVPVFAVAGSLPFVAEAIAGL